MVLQAVQAHEVYRLWLAGPREDARQLVRKEGNMRKVHLRKRPRPYPNLVFSPDKPRNCYGEYDAITNTLTVNMSVCECEEDVVRTILHEEVHWVMEMYLQACEVYLEWANMPDYRVKENRAEYDSWVPESVALYVEGLVWGRIEKCGRTRKRGV